MLTSGFDIVNASERDFWVTDDLRFVGSDDSRFKHDLLTLETDSCCRVTKCVTLIELIS
jgi:hypothetical protein